MLFTLYIGPGTSGTVDVTDAQFYTARIMDIGRLVADTSIVNTTKSGYGGTVTPPTPPATKKQYTSVWQSNYGATYKGNGDRRTDTTYMVQGYNSTNGDGAAYCGFTGAAIQGETSKTITTALSGATVTAVQVYLYANHWYYNSGGTARIGYHGQTGVASSKPSANYQQFNVTGWKKPEGRWVTIPKAWWSGIKSGAIRGITLGSAGTTNKLYYGRFDGPGGAHPPKIKISYTR